MLMRTAHRRMPFHDRASRRLDVCRGVGGGSAGPVMQVNEGMADAFTVFGACKLHWQPRIVGRRRPVRFTRDGVGIAPRLAGYCGTPGVRDAGIEYLAATHHCASTRGAYDCSLRRRSVQVVRWDFNSRAAGVRDIAPTARSSPSARLVVAYTAQEREVTLLSNWGRVVGAP